MNSYYDGGVPHSALSEGLWMFYNMNHGVFDAFMHLESLGSLIIISIIM